MTSNTVLALLIVAFIVFFGYKMIKLLINEYKKDVIRSVILDSDTDTINNMAWKEFPESGGIQSGQRYAFMVGAHAYMKMISKRSHGEHRV